MRANYKLQRLYVDFPLSINEKLRLQDKSVHYLKNVLRMKEKDRLLVFNGRDGEYLAEISQTHKKYIEIVVLFQQRLQPKAGDLIYCFAPLKTGRLDYMVQKAVEMGVSSLQPVITEYTQLSRMNADRLKANIIEAAEQCGVLALPHYHHPIKLQNLLDNWPKERHLIFCDEAANLQNPLPLLQKLERAPLALLIGPEGGFSDKERAYLRQFPFVHSIPLGPRILRADTAAVAALSMMQAVLGDWQDR